MRDIILAGVPRSGTTLACVLLNRLPNTVALNEPFAISTLPQSDNEAELVHRLRAMFQQERASLLETRQAASRGQAGRIVSNVFSPERGADGLRYHLAGLQKQSVAFDKSLSKDFALAVKHPNAFTVLLPVLKHHFPCYAIVRNPLAVLLSWDSTAAHWQDGRVTVAELFDHRLRQALDRIEHAIDRRVEILRHYFDIYRQHLPRTSVVRYEDMVEDAEQALGAVLLTAGLEAPPLANMNCNSVYSRGQASVYLAKLLARRAAWEPFYEDTQIEQLGAMLGKLG